LALGYFHLQEYALAKKYAQALLTIEPENLQAITLLDQINSKVTTSTYIFLSEYEILVFLNSEGIIGLALVGGIAAAVTGIVIASLKSNPKRT
jgi:hypothetical protein